MTCASCAARVEKKLSRVGGVEESSVNYATEQATVVYDPTQVELADLLEAVSAAGYSAHLHGEAAREGTSVWQRLVVAVALTVPLTLIAMVPPLQFDGWEWAALALATPVVLWAGWPFHRAAFRNARHRAVTMDTLISIGTLAAWAWSTVVLVGGIDAEMYFEVGAVIVTLILVGRYLEERAKSRAGAAVRALLELGAKEARVLRNGEEVLVPIAELEVGDRFVVRPGEKIATDGIVEEGESAIDQSMLTGESVPIEVGSGAEIAGGTINTYGRLDRPGDAGRRGDGAGADRASRRRGSGGQGAGPAPRGPRVGRVRAGRDRHLSGHARRLARLSPAMPAKRSRQPSRCSSSPAPARSASPRPQR